MFLEKNDQRPGFLLILGPKVAQQLDLWGQYIPPILKYLQWAYEAKLMWNYCERVEKITKDLNFCLFGV